MIGKFRKPRKDTLAKELLDAIELSCDGCFNRLPIMFNPKGERPFHVWPDSTRTLCQIPLRQRDVLRLVYGENYIKAMTQHEYDMLRYQLGVNRVRYPHPCPVCKAEQGKPCEGLPLDEVHKGRI